MGAIEKFFQSIYRERILFKVIISYFGNVKVLHQISNEEERAALKRSAISQLKEKQLRLHDKLAIHDFHYDASNLFEPTMERIKETIQKTLEK